MKKINVLMVISSLDRANGITSYVMNYYRNMPNINMDFIVTSDNIKNEYYDEIIKNKNKVYFIESNKIKKIFSTIRNIKTFMKINSSKYDIIHCNVANIGLMYLYYAKKYGIKKRIIHSHATVTAETFGHKVRNEIIIPVTIKYANYYFACSDAAGKAMFKNKKFIIVNNAIDYKKFYYMDKYRKDIREKLKISEETFVIGNIGRLSNQKNHLFMIDIINKMKNENCLLMLVGNGPNEKLIKEKVKRMQLENKVIFLGSRNDVYKLYSCFDVLILPSLFEGLPVVGIEAQANGVPCIFSNEITREVKISENVMFLGIKEDNIDNWIENIKKIKRNNRKKPKIITSYDIYYCAKELENKYYKIVGE